MSRSRPGTATSRRSGCGNGDADPGVQMILNKIKLDIKSRGGTGFFSLQRRFKIMDDDGNKSLNLSEFKKAMKDMKIDLPDNDLRKVFEYFDQDRGGSISFEEFIQGIRDPLNQRRLDLVKTAFSIIDVDGNGEVDVREIASKYDTSKHPDVISRRRSSEEVLREFMGTFEVGGNKDGIITFKEFCNYYANISASIDNEDYFELMIRNAWHISGGEGQAANTANKRVMVTGADGTQVVVEIKNDLGLKAGDKDEMMRRLKAQGVDARNIDINGTGGGGGGDKGGDGFGLGPKRRNKKKMSGRRRKLLRTVFRILDTDGSGSVDAAEMAEKYDTSKHPDVMAGISTKEQVLLEFLANFEVGGVKDGMVTEEEFLNYYEGLSASIENEDYFELMVRNAWHLSGGRGQAANTANRRVLVTARDGTQTVQEIKNDLGIAAGDKTEMVRRLKNQGVDVADIGLTSGPGGGKGTTRPGTGGNAFADRRAPLSPRRPKTVPPPPKIPLQQKLVVETLLDVMRAQLMVRGAGGVIDLQRRFMDMDIDGTNTLDKEEFRNGMAANGFTFSKNHIDALFNYFDRDASGEIEYEEFLEGLRGRFPEALEQQLNKIFDRMRPDAADTVNPQQVLDQYNPRGHPDAKARLRSPEEIYQEFVDTFDVGGEVMGAVTRDDFIKYHRNIAISMNNDFNSLDKLIHGVWSVTEYKRGCPTMKSPGRRYMASTGLSFGDTRQGKPSTLASKLRQTTSAYASEPDYDDRDY